MAKKEIEYITDPVAQDQIRSYIGGRLNYARAFWKPLHTRQDYWMTMYTLLDAIQQSKPLGRRRFITNEPRTAVDAALAIITRHPIHWRLDLTRDAEEDIEERHILGKIERSLTGLFYEIDDVFAERGEPSFWVQVGLQALLRGWIWAKAHITTEALEYREAPLISEVYDSRCVYPLFDQYGLNCVLIEKLCSLGELVMLYPDVFGAEEGKRGYNPWTPAIKMEFWSNTRGTDPGISCTLANTGRDDITLLESPMGTEGKFIIPPYEHGYSSDALPVVGAPVNGVAIKAKPSIAGILESRMSAGPDRFTSQMAQWNGPGTWVADSGRSILSAVEDQIPQYNELIATIFQHFSIGTYGTWVFKTRTGEMPDFQGGIEAKVAMRPEESAQRFEPTPITPDAFRLIEILSQERQRGVLSNILYAVGPFAGIESGSMLQQVTNAALNAVQPYINGMQQFGTRLGSSILKQMQLASGKLKPFQVVTPSTKRSYFRIEFDPKTDLDKKRKYRPVPVMKPALPDDFITRLTAARMALDPRRPMMSLITVLETILQVEDPAGELDRIWEDIAQTDPVLVAEQIAVALERLGEPEMAARMREQEFRQKFVEDLRFRQMTGNVPAAPGGPGPETGAPTATQRTGEAATQGEGLGGEGAALLGALGETVQP